MVQVYIIFKQATLSATQNYQGYTHYVLKDKTKNALLFQRESLKLTKIASKL